MTPTQTLCQAAGMDVKTAAKKARLHPRYLADCINNGCSYETAERLSRILGCDINVFIGGYDRWKQFSRKS